MVSDATARWQASLLDLSASSSRGGLSAAGVLARKSVNPSRTQTSYMLAAVTAIMPHHRLLTLDTLVTKTIFHDDRSVAEP